MAHLQCSRFLGIHAKLEKRKYDGNLISFKWQLRLIITPIDEIEGKFVIAM